MKCIEVPVVIAAAILVGGAWTGTFAQFPLQVHYLTDQQRASFSAQDSAVAPFWAGSMEPGDSLEVAGPSDCIDMCDISGAQDASVSMKAYGDLHGLYLLFRVSDDEWAPRHVCTELGGNRIVGDELFVLLDPLSPDSLVNPSSWLAPDATNGWFCTLTARTLGLRLWFGNFEWMPVLSMTKHSTRPSTSYDTGTTIQYAPHSDSRPDSAAWEWGEEPGMRWVEVYIPWRLLAGSDASWLSGLATGTEFSVWVGYGDSDDYCRSDWLHKPRVCPYYVASPGGEWGGAMLAEPPVGYSWTSSSNVTRYRASAGTLRAGQAEPTWYTLTGRRIEGQRPGSRPTGAHLQCRGTADRQRVVNIEAQW
jgi:hypothetical protein